MPNAASHARTPLLLAASAALLLGACNCSDEPTPTEPTPDETSAPTDAPALERLRFNQLAMRLNLPLFWASDDGDGEIEPAEVRALRFYGATPTWVVDGAFTPEFEEAQAAIVAANAEPAPEDERLAAVHQELLSTAPTLIENDLSEMPAAHREFARRMANVVDMVDDLYARQVGMTALEGRIAEADPASASLFRRNWGPKCRGSQTESIEACSAIEGAPAQPVDVYPAAMQADDDFCQALETHADHETLLTPFSVVREVDGALTAVPYTEAYAEQMRPIAAELRAAVTAMTDEDEGPLRAYLTAAAQAFEDNQWEPADEAWAAMNMHNSRWYVRVGPDEVYWDPCSQKAGFHVTFARINEGSLTWQQRLTPLLPQMEGALAALAPGEYEAREVNFHLPDFIDIVLNSGDDRDPFGATIGQSLPNWGPVSDEGRGRTVAMTNLYTDDDSAARGRAVAESLLVTEAMERYTSDAQPGLMSTILHEATHNLGPASGHMVDGQNDSQVFGGGLASMLEELKAQSGALFFVRMLREQGVLTQEEAEETYLDSITWAFGHISRGMYTPSGQRKAYSQLAAIQVGFLMDRGVLTWDAEATAANGEDQGAFRVDFAGLPAAIDALMTAVMHIKAAGDRAEAERLATQYVDGETVPMATITERFARSPRGTFVFSLSF